MLNIEKARLSLEGLSVADALGAFFEFSTSDRLSQFIVQRQVPKGTWRFTDDTNMALSVYAVLRIHQHIDQDALAASFATYFDPSRGYGPGVRALVSRFKNGQSWSEISPKLYGGGSYGNGGAMRAAPIGAYFSDDMTAVVENARRSAEVTHAHAEGIAGAIAVAAATAIAFQFRQQPTLYGTKFLLDVIPHIPPGIVRLGCEQALMLPPDTSTNEAARILGNGSLVTAQDTIPFVLWCASTYLHNYEEAIWQCLSAGGDADTTSAMVGGIVAMAVGEDGIPRDWIAQREALPQWSLG